MHFSKKSLDIIAGFFQAYTPDIIGIAELKDKPNQVDYLAEKTGLSYNAFRCKYKPKSKLKFLPGFKHNGNAMLSRYPFSSLHYYDFTASGKTLVIHGVIKDINYFVVHLSLIKKIRNKQFAELTAILKQTKGPIIVMGDFNTSNSNDFAELLKETNLSFANTDGKKTYPAWKPRKRIDHILISKEIIIKRFEAITVNYSDHLPLLLDYDVRFIE